MTTITLKINEKSKAGKILTGMIDLLSKNKSDVEIIEEPKSTYNSKFVAKIQKARKEKGREILPNEDLWESIK